MRTAKADARENAIRLDRLEQRQSAVAARIAARRDEVAGVKQDLIDTRVGYENTRAGKRRALLQRARESRHSSRARSRA